MKIVQILPHNRNTNSLYNSIFNLIMLETFIHFHYCSISASFSKHEFLILVYVHIRHFVKAHFPHEERSPVQKHHFQPASLNKILETRIFSASTSPVLSLCVMMNVCIKRKTKSPKILKFYRTEDWNWHHLQIFISIFNFNIY